MLVLIAWTLELPSCVIVVCASVVVICAFMRCRGRARFVTLMSLEGIGDAARGRTGVTNAPLIIELKIARGCRAVRKYCLSNAPSGRGVPGYVARAAQ